MRSGRNRRSLGSLVCDLHHRDWDRVFQYLSPAYFPMRRPAARPVSGCSGTSANGDRFRRKQRFDQGATLRRVPRLPNGV